MRNYDAYENYVINSKRDFETTERGRRRQQDKTEREYRDLSRSPPKSTEFRDAEKVARRLEETAISTRTNEAVGYMKKAFKDFDVFHVQIRPEKHYSTMDITIEEADGYKMTHETRQKDAKKKNSVNPAVVTGDRPTVSITLPISTERNYRYEVTISRDRKKILISETEYRLAEALSGADRAIDYNQKCAKNVNRERVKASVDDFVEHVIEVVYHCISWKGDKKNIVVEHDEIDETDYNMELDQLEDGKKSRK